jgi:hypothetical protein
MMVKSLLILVIILPIAANGLIPLLDGGGTKMPSLYKSWFDDQMARQASTAVSKAIATGNVRG